MPGIVVADIGMAVETERDAIIRGVEPARRLWNDMITFHLGAAELVTDATAPAARD